MPTKPVAKKTDQKPELDREKAKYYLDYLDKEMTFTGIITTFCVGAVFFMVEKIFSKEVTDVAKNSIASHTYFQNPYFIVPIFYMSSAAWLLVWHRSKLAFNYGQISLEIYTECFSIYSLDHWLKDVDTWEFWYRYFAALMLIVCSFLLFSVFVFTTQFNPSSSASVHSIWNFFKDYAVISVPLLTLIAVGIELLHLRFLAVKYPNNSFERQGSTVV